MMMIDFKIATPTGRYTHAAEETISRIKALLPEAKVLDAMPEGEYRADFTIEYYKSDRESKQRILRETREKLLAGNPIPVGSIIWVETTMGPRRALVLRVHADLRVDRDLYLLEYFCVIQRASGVWGCDMKGYYPGYIERGFEAAAKEKNS